MKQTASKQKVAQSAAPVHNQEMGAEAQGVALVPPVYGAETVAQQRVDREQQASIVQAKLTIGAPNDPYEREADHVAAQVVQRLHAPASPGIQLQAAPEAERLQMKPLLQLKEREDSFAAPPALESSIQQLRGQGQPLAPQIRQPMERAFGVDFSGVRVHTDAQADQLNQSMQAKAFTTGQDLFFRHRAYQPESGRGQELIAHELTHVIQQRSSRAPNSFNLGVAMVQDQALEAEAEQRSRQIPSHPLFSQTTWATIPSNDTKGASAHP